MGNNQSNQTLFTKSMDAFSDQFYRELNLMIGGEAIENKIFSPFQIYVTLFTLYLATDGQTKFELRTVLKLNETKLTEKAIHESILQILRGCEEKNEDRKSRTKCISSLFVASDYKDKIQRKFNQMLLLYGKNLDLQFLDFRDSLMKWTVDRWCIQRTGGLMTSCTGRHCLLPPLFHVDLMYLVGQFDVSSGKTHPTRLHFRDPSNNVTETCGTFFIGECLYLHDITHRIRVIEIPLKSNPDLSVLIALPEKKNGMRNDRFISNIHEEIRTWLECLTTRSEMEVWIPHLKFTSSVEIKSLLKKLGAPSLFEESSDFSGMAMLTPYPLYLTAVHANINVDFSVESSGREGDNFDVEEDIYQQSARVPFRVEHPFLFIAVHRPTAAIFVLARIDTLKEQNV